MEIRWARTARKHHITRQSSEYVVRNATNIFAIPAPAGARLRDDRLLFLGADQDAALLEVGAVTTTRGVLVIHAMPIRPRYLPYLKDQDDA